MIKTNAENGWSVVKFFLRSVKRMDFYMEIILFSFAVVGMWRQDFWKNDTIFLHATACPSMVVVVFFACKRPDQASSTLYNHIQVLVVGGENKEGLGAIKQGNPVDG